MERGAQRGCKLLVLSAAKAEEVPKEWVAEKLDKTRSVLMEEGRLGEVFEGGQDRKRPSSIVYCDSQEVTRKVARASYRSSIVLPSAPAILANVDAPSEPRPMTAPENNAEVTKNDEEGFMSKMEKHIKNNFSALWSKVRRFHRLQAIR